MINGLKITSKVVRRWFVDGKGFASEMAAAKYLAMKELKRMAYEVSLDKEFCPFDGHAMPGVDEERLHQFFRDKFPLHPKDSLGFRESVTIGGNPHYAEEDEHYKYHGKEWCNGCRWDWIRNRAREIIRAGGIDDRL